MTTSLTITDDRAAFDALERSMLGFVGLGVEVGYLEPEQATKAGRHEFGAGVPKREHVAPATDAAEPALAAKATREVGDVVDGRETAGLALTQVGELAAKSMRDTGVFCLKMHVGQLVSMNRDFGMCVESMEFDRVIYLYRADKIAQAVSLAKAHLTDQFRSYERDRSNEDKTPTFQQVATALATVLGQDEFMRQYMMEHVDEECSYEDFQRLGSDATRRCSINDRTHFGAKNTLGGRTLQQLVKPGDGFHQAYTVGGILRFTGRWRAASQTDEVQIISWLRASLAGGFQHELRSSRGFERREDQIAARR